MHFTPIDFEDWKDAFCMNTFNHSHLFLVMIWKRQIENRTIPRTNWKFYYWSLGYNATLIKKSNHAFLQNQSTVGCATSQLISFAVKLRFLIVMKRGGNIGGLEARKSFTTYHITMQIADTMYHLCTGDTARLRLARQGSVLVSWDQWVIFSRRLGSLPHSMPLAGHEYKWQDVYEWN